ncbi:MAG TPA: phenylacetate--CoA ligase [Solirubrobacteraceae bacterium]|jgi:phenylacetate-CoA ligase|nr:phenylacetate--CoA ligase [Solirubrobacteraceae bacterium]
MPPTALSEFPSIRDRHETLDREELRALQLRRLRETVARVLADQPAGAAKLRVAGIADAADIGRLSDIDRVPFTVKQDLRDHYPFGLLAVPRAELVRVHASSGTHGKATIVGYTRNDLENWTELMARCMTMAGVRPGMLVHNANGYGLFTGGFGFHQGAERLGAAVVPVGAGFTARQITLIVDLGADVLVSTPSYALAIAAAMRESGVDPATLNLKLGLFGGEHATRRMRDEIERELGLTSITNYGLSEMCGPGVACECIHERDGLHVQEDHYMVEVVEPDSGRVLAPGEAGELVFTTLTKEALPLIRYRTGDLGRVTLEPCSCGRTTARLVDIAGRRDDMITVRGINVFPSTVEHLLLGVEGVAPVYRLIVERPAALDELTLEVEIAGDGDRAVLTLHLERLLREHMGMRINVTVQEPGSLPRSEGKAVRVIDRR